MKHLIIPGMAKAGTTFLFDQLKKNTSIFNVPIYKETNFFVKKDSLCDLKDFYNSADDSRWYLDASPIYLNGDIERLKNIEKCLINNEVKMLICLRSPFEQIFSHYLHDLKGLWCRVDLPLRSRNYHFYSKMAVNKYFRKKYNCVKFLLENFGHENVVGLNKKDTYSDTSQKTLEFMMNEKLLDFNFSSRSNPGGWLPYFIFSRNKSVEFCDGNDVYIVPKGCLLLVNGERSKLYVDYPARKAEEIIIDSQTWTKELFYNDEIFEDINEDYVSICEVLGVEPEFREKNVIVAKSAKLSQDLKNKLKKIT